MAEGDTFQEQEGARRELDGSATVGDCVSVLAAAFAREPATHWICGTSTPVRERWFASTLATHATLPGARRLALVDERGRPVAAAVLTAPHTAPSVGARTAWVARTALRCGPAALGRTLKYLQVTEEETPAGAWTLEFIGVVPDHRGRGAARRLLDHVLSTLPAPDGVFLTTADPANESLYHRFGFTTLRHLGVGPLTTVAMWRPHLRDGG
ncbi:GNAT family N-acetyltransferase [Streptomyces sp. NPDC127068]|uniref:GNAT family N-acetyltransferase n=1 Tax=Streptomyces sp. NPDC127068 TaxID=3347127 RepID=UPI00365D6306